MCLTVSLCYCRRGGRFGRLGDHHPRPSVRSCGRQRNGEGGRHGPPALRRLPPQRQIGEYFTTANTTIATTTTSSGGTRLVQGSWPKRRKRPMVPTHSTQPSQPLSVFADGYSVWTADRRNHAFIKNGKQLRYGTNFLFFPKTRFLLLATD